MKASERTGDQFWLGVCMLSLLAYLLCSEAVRMFLRESARLMAKL